MWFVIVEMFVEYFDFFIMFVVLGGLWVVVSGNYVMLWLLLEVFDCVVFEYCLFVLNV